MKAPLLTDCPDHCGAQITPALVKQINDPEDFDAFCPTDASGRIAARMFSDQYDRDRSTVHNLLRLPIAV